MNDFSRCLRSVVVTACAYSLIALLPATANASTEQVWQFRLYLDDTPIGYHEWLWLQSETSSGRLLRYVIE